MAKMTQCGSPPPAKDRRAYCPTCAAIEATEDDNQIDAIFDRLDRIKRIHRAYRRRQ